MSIEPAVPALDLFIRLSNGSLDRLSGGTFAASPATISCLGIIYIPKELNSLNYLVLRRVQGDQECASIINLIINVYSTTVADLKTENSGLKMMTGIISTVRKGLHLISVAKDLSPLIHHLCNSSPKNFQSDFLKKVKLIVASEYCDVNDSQDVVIFNSNFIFTDYLRKQLVRIQGYMDKGVPFIFTGPSGSGKMTIVKAAIDAFFAPCSIIKIQCISSTDPSMILSLLEQNSISIMTSRGRTLKPKMGNRIFLLLKHISLPKAD
jgi:hypothetical protein